MAGIQGKLGRNIEKQTVKESNVPSTGFKAVRALHEAVLSDTFIDITALTAPAAAVANGYNAPNASDLQKVSLRQFKENVTLRTSSTTLIQDIDFVIAGARRINLTTPATAAQVYELIINAEPRVGVALLDARPLIATGVLIAGATDFNVGTPFAVGKFPSHQAGSVAVYADGALLRRNVGNQAAGAGDYYEVHAGAGLGVIIRFTATGANRDVSVFSIGAIAEKPNGSQDALIDTLAGQIDVIREEVELQHGVTIPPGAPNNIDLKAFGDRVLANEIAIAASGGGLSAVVDDLSPQFGADFDTNGFDLRVPAGQDFQIATAGASSDILVRVLSGNVGTSTHIYENGVGVTFTVGQERSSGGNLATGTNPFAGVLVTNFGDLQLGVGGVISATIGQSNGFLSLSSAVVSVTERLFVDGRIQINPEVAPGITANKLYNIGGTIFWNGIDLTAGAGGLADIVDDTSPQLGGTLDVNGFGFSSTDAALPITIGTGLGDDFSINTTGLVYKGDTGNVGVGTSLPATPLEISGVFRFSNGAAPGEYGELFDDGSVTRFNSSVNSLFITSANDLRLQANVVPTADVYLVSGSAGFIKFRQDATERMIIDITGNVGIGVISPDANAILDVVSTTKAFMPPRMTAVQRDAIASPNAGMVVYNTTTNSLDLYDSIGWGAIGAGGGGGGFDVITSPVTEMQIFDEFASGDSNDGSIGSLGWGKNVSFSGNVISNSDPQNTGVALLRTGATLGSESVITMHSNAGNNAVDFSSDFDVLFIVDLRVSASNAIFRFGTTSSSVLVPSSPVNGVYIEKLVGDVNWIFVTRSGGTETRTNSNVAAVTGVAHRFRMRRKDASTISFSVDEGVEVDHTTNIPVGGGMPAVGVSNNEASDKNIAIDYFGLKITGLSR